MEILFPILSKTGLLKVPGPRFGAHNNNPQNPKSNFISSFKPFNKEFDLKEQSVDPFSFTGAVSARPNLSYEIFLFSKQQPHLYVVIPPPTHKHVMQNCDGYRNLEEFCLHKK